MQFRHLHQKQKNGDNSVFDDNEIQMFAKEYINEEVNTNVFKQFVERIFKSKDKINNLEDNYAEISYEELIVQQEQINSAYNIDMTKIIIDNYKKLSNNIEMLKNASLNDVANFIKENRVQILKLENDSFLKLPKIRDLYIKEISLQIKKTKILQKEMFY